MYCRVTLVLPTNGKLECKFLQRNMGVWVYGAIVFFKLDYDLNQNSNYHENFILAFFIEKLRRAAKTAAPSRRVLKKSSSASSCILHI